MTPSNTPDKRRWTIDKSIPLSVIFLVAGQALAGALFVMDLKKDVEVLKVNDVEHARRMAQIENVNGTAVEVLRSDIREVSRKVDQVLLRAK